MKYLVFAFTLLMSLCVFAAPIRKQNHVVEYVYDFGVSGGAVGVIDLSAIAGQPALPVGAIVDSVRLKVVTAFTSSGSATVSWGTVTDTDGFSGTAIAYGTLTDNYLSVGSSPALLPAAGYLVGSGNASKPAVEIGTAALTAGKALIIVDYYMPSID